MNFASDLLLYQLTDAGRLDGLDWQPFRVGVEIHPLGTVAAGWQADERAPPAALLRYAAQAEVPRHLHPGFEYIFVLRGSQSIQSDTGDAFRECQAGSLLVSPPGSIHRVRSEHGCVVLAYWERKVQFL